MSGHSKWATIKRQKGATDAKRGQLFTKLSMAISIAVRQGGGVTDPNSNFKLRLAVDKARAAN
ncbi:MAG TPA: YebC/PmpR family DNA-binding transcriptional regulator, partial [Patescibacteria group bacterium]|nr:YebC/PmpR family DNA-binding transcriptional regulator [Patescibacteria group bacterium]